EPRAVGRIRDGEPVAQDAGGAAAHLLLGEGHGLRDAAVSHEGSQDPAPAGAARAVVLAPDDGEAPVREQADVEGGDVALAGRERQGLSLPLALFVEEDGLDRAEALLLGLEAVLARGLLATLATDHVGEDEASLPGQELGR